MKVVAVYGVLAAALSSLASGNQYLKEYIKQSYEKNTQLGFMKDVSERPPSVRNQPSTCVNGFADVNGEAFECDNVDFYSFISSAELKIVEPESPGNSADIWGWRGPSGREYTLLTLDNGCVVIDSTNPFDPCIVAKLPTTRNQDIWSDNKVYKDTMYFVKDSSIAETPDTAEVGVEVYDLLPFDGIDCSNPNYEIPTVFPDYVVPTHGASHNVLVNTETGRLYTVGARICAGGMVAFDLNANRLEPEFIRCIDSDGYTHDAQCVVYTGPDVRYQGREICIAFNEDTLTIWDVTDISPTQDATLLSRTLYLNQAYSHQGWFNREMDKVLLDDELDELCNTDEPPAFCDFLVASGLNGVKTTSTYVWDVTDLENPLLENQFIHPELSIDHNLYIWGPIHENGWGGNDAVEFFPDPNFAYLNNYMAGLRVLDIRDNDSTNWFQAGFFDTTPNDNRIEFLGVWSGYMHPSGVYALSNVQTGIFFLQPNMVFSDEFPAPPPVDITPSPTPSPTVAVTDPPTNFPTNFPTDPVTAAPTDDDGGDGGDVDDIVEIAVIVLFVAAILLAIAACMLLFKVMSAGRAQTAQQAYQVKV